MSSPASFPNSTFSAAEPRRIRFNKGGSYLLVRDSGHPQQFMRVVQEAVEAGEHCLLISSKSQTLLTELASKNAFDLQSAVNTNLLGLLKSPTRDELAAFGDVRLSQAFSDLIQLGETQNARQVVVDDVSAFLQFRVFDELTTVFRKFVRDAADIETTFILSLEEPTNEFSERLMHFIQGEVTGSIRARIEPDLSFPANLDAFDSQAIYSLEADFRAVREASGLTVEDIQKRIRLATAIIKRFEDGLVIGDPSFKAEYVRTILRSYADALGLGQQKVRSALEAFRAGTYRGELHPDYQDSISLRPGDKGQRSLNVERFGPLPEATALNAAAHADSLIARGAVFGKTIKGIMKRKQGNGNKLVESLFRNEQRAAL